MLLFLCGFLQKNHAQSSCEMFAEKHHIRSASSKELEKIYDSLTAMIHNQPALVQCVAQSAIERCKEVGNEKIEVNYRMLDAYALMSLGAYKKSIQRYLLVLRLGEKRKDKDVVRSASSNLASTYLKVGNLNLAEKYYRLAYRNIDPSKKDADSKLTRFYMNFGLLKNERQQSDSAIYYFKKAERIFVGDSVSLATLYLNIGLSYSSLNEYGLAEDYLLRAKNIYQRFDDMDGECRSLLNLAEINSARGKFELALVQAGQAKGIARIIGDPSLQLSALQILEEGYENLGDFQLALENNKAVALLNDSINSLELKKEIEELNKQYETEKKDRRIVTFKNQLVAQEQQETIIVGSLISAVVILLLTILLYRQQRQKNKLLEELVEQKGFLMGEVHHRVKNNLQLVSSMLEMQLVTMEDEVAKNVLLDNRNRIFAMSVLHQRLYQQDDAKFVDTTPYFTYVIKAIFNALNSGNQLFLKLEIDALRLSINDAVPIGLMINELMTNAFKYAFVLKKRGTISVALLEREKSLILQFSDDGDGMAHVKDHSKPGYGTQLISSLNRQMKGKQHCVTNENGTTYRFEFTRFEKDE